MLVRLFLFLLCWEPISRIALSCVHVQEPSLVPGHMNMVENGRGSVLENFQACGDGVLNIGEECDDGNRIFGDGCQGNCKNPVCGDGSVDQGEQCDDGNTTDGDGCQADCQEPKCGDGIVDMMLWEECDDGNNVDGDGTCQSHCKLPVCGDGVVDAILGEECDDGNRAYGDGCQGDCRNPVCGDGTVDSGEQCDDGNTKDADGCQGNCMYPRCGDGIIDIANNEQCDDGNNIDADGTCQGNCKLPVCGDGIVDFLLGEDCDDGNRDYGDGCQGNCKNPVCGDGTIDSGEQCDDGNNINADGCQANCMLPKCGDGIMDMFLGEECDDGNNNNNDRTCQGNCKLPMCGDKIVDTVLGEECDDGNRIFGDGCQGNCLLPVCGDGTVDAGEQCDDGNTADADGCQGNCMLPKCGDGIMDMFLGEECDDGNNDDDDMTCQGNCKLPMCGDKIVDTTLGEECDDGNTIFGDGCQGNCLNPVCGDGITDFVIGEQCDDGNTDDNLGPCPADCIMVCPFESCVNNDAGFGIVNNPCPSPDCTENGCQCAMSDGSTLNVATGACPLVSAVAINAPDGSCVLSQTMGDFTLSCFAPDLTAVGQFDGMPATTQIPMVTKLGCSCPAGCSPFLDLLFILDSSPSVGNYGLIVDTVQLIVRSFVVGPLDVQVSVIVMDMVPANEVQFDFQSIVQSNQPIDAAIDSLMPLQSTSSAIVSALMAAQTTFVNTGRPGANRVAMVFSDGQFTDPAGTIGPEAANLRALATVLAVGTGIGFIDIPQLMLVTNNLNNVYPLSNNELIQNVPVLVDAICAAV